MLAIIGALLFGMKAVVTVEARADGMPALAAWKWLGFAALWPGMRPAIFAAGRRRPAARRVALVGMGCVRGCVGLVLALAGLARLAPRAAAAVGCGAVRPGDGAAPARGEPDAAFRRLQRPGGAVAAGGRRCPAAVPRPARGPLAGRLLGPAVEPGLLGDDRAGDLSARCRACSGGRPRPVAAFLASGLLHELAISVPVLAGFGLPLLYFLLHGALVLVERGLESGAGGRRRGACWAHVWVLGWLAVPVPILFHLPFLRGVVWPLIGMG